MERRALRPTEAMARLGVGRTTLWELTRSGELSSVRIGRSRRYLDSDLDAFLARHRHGVTAGDPAKPFDAREH